MSAPGPALVGSGPASRKERGKAAAGRARALAALVRVRVRVRAGVRVTVRVRVRVRVRAREHLGPHRLHQLPASRCGRGRTLRTLTAWG